MNHDLQNHKQVQEDVLSSETSNSARQGWAAASQAIAEAGEDELVLWEFANAGDEALEW